MKNTIGSVITLTVFGESHGPAIGGVLDGLPSGIRIDEDGMRRMMSLRRGGNALSTARNEADIPEFLSGVRNGHTEGTPVAFLIKNTDARRKDYEDISSFPRPSHADYTAQLKYNGFQDASGGGHFSGRLTAVYTAAGALLRSVLAEKGVLIGTHILQLYTVRDRDFSTQDPEGDVRLLGERSFPVLDEEKGGEMTRLIRETAAEKDSLGGILETAVTGLPAGIGEPLFDSLESRLAHYMFSVPAVKGIEFGLGADFAKKKGSEANDAFGLKDGKIVTLSNHNGGINGGISSGMPVLFRTAVKPTPSIGLPQKTVDIANMREMEITITGRHDPAIVHRAAAVQDAMCALCLADAAAEWFGPQYLRNGI